MRSDDLVVAGPARGNGDAAGTAHESLRVSVVVLTYNRGPLVRQLVESLLRIDYRPLEIVVVDNCSDEPARKHLAGLLAEIRLVEMESNLGVAGRNRGIEASSGEIVVTLDDDVYGLDGEKLRKVIGILSDPAVGAVCFKVLDTENRVTNWCHHYDVATYSDRRFITNEITEGAVAFKRAVLRKSGLYPGHFFISHEGPDLAYRIMNQGFLVVYSPEIRVVHRHSLEGRVSWRRYYYDTRNLLWLAVRNYRFLYGVKWTGIGIAAMFVYALRDGYVRHWGRGVRDGLLGLRQAYRQRIAPRPDTWAIVEEIERHRPGFWTMVGQRLFKKGIRI